MFLLLHNKSHCSEFVFFLMTGKTESECLPKTDAAVVQLAIGVVSASMAVSEHCEVARPIEIGCPWTTKNWTRQ